MANPQRGVFETLEDLICFAPVAFAVTDILRIEDSIAGMISTPDFDGDGDLDILASGDEDHPIVILENRQGQGFVETRLPNGSEARYAWAADFDNDGDSDIIADRRLYENLGDGQIDPRPRNLIGPSNVDFDPFTSRMTGFAADIDEDGDVDLLVTIAKGIGWLENTGELDWNESVSADAIVTFDHELEDANPGGNLGFIDVDSDGFRDVVAYTSGSNGARSVLWYKHVDGRGQFSSSRILISSLPESHDHEPTIAQNFADLNNDGFLDLVVSVRREQFLGWYPNLGEGEFGEIQTIIDFEGTRKTHEGIAIGDLDGDDDEDLVVYIKDPGSSRSNQGPFWYENETVESTTNFEPRAIANVRYDLWSNANLVIADMNIDGAMDIIGFDTWSRDADNSVYFEQRVLGDSNGDGAFNSSDLVAVFQVNEFEDAIPQNSTYEEGDWNGDGEFTSADFVFAFRGGHYENGINAARQTETIFNDPAFMRVAAAARDDFLDDANLAGDLHRKGLRH